MREFELIPSLVATLCGFALGAIWYSPWLFGKAWLRESGLSDEQVASVNPVKVYGLTLLLNLVAAIAFSMVITPNTSFFMAFHSGVGIGLFWIATAFGVICLFEQKSLKYWAINAGYFLAMYTTYGLVFGLL